MIWKKVPVLPVTLLVAGSKKKKKQPPCNPHFSNAIFMYTSI